ncbi:MAG: SsrA-binding protein SmpB [Candidatus Brocadiia bacterium]
MPSQNDNIRVVARNRKASHDYVIEDTYEAGLVLKGPEVKSLRQSQCSIEEAFARPAGNAIYLYDMHISPYQQSTIDRLDPKRPRKLLLHKSEIDRIMSQCTQRGYTLVPLKVYFRRGWAKALIGLAQKRKHGDKRRKKLDRQRRQEAEREIRRHERGG